MAALDFKNRSAVLALLVTWLPQVDASLIEALLDASAGSDCEDPDVPIYRPFYVRAQLMAQATGEFESVSSAAGSSVTYRDNARGIRAMLRQQAALDKSICGIPEGFEALGGGSVRVATVF